MPIAQSSRNGHWVKIQLYSDWLSMVNVEQVAPGLTALGRDALDRYLGEICGNPDELPEFLTDHELAQLYARGTSWCVRGGVVVVRNATHGRKVVSVPAGALLQVSGKSGLGADRVSREVILVIIPGTSTIDLVP